MFPRKICALGKEMDAYDKKIKTRFTKKEKRERVLSYIDIIARKVRDFLRYYSVRRSVENT